MEDIITPGFTIIEESSNPVEEDFDSTVEEILSPKTNPEGPVYIDDLEDVVVNGEWTAREGQSIVVEKWNCFNVNRPRWMGTSIYVIKGIDPLTGDVKMHDEELKQSCYTNVRKGPRAGWRFKFATVGLNLHKRAKPVFLEQKVAKEARDEARKQAVANGEKRVGRPKGVKNRSKDVIAAEKKVRALEKLAKKEARAAKRASKK